MYILSAFECCQGSVTNTTLTALKADSILYTNTISNLPQLPQNKTQKMLF